MFPTAHMKLLCRWNMFPASNNELPAVKTAANQLYSPLTWNEHDAKSTERWLGAAMVVSWLHQVRGPHHVLWALRKHKSSRLLCYTDSTVGRCLFIGSGRKRTICGFHLLSNLKSISFYHQVAPAPHRVVLPRTCWWPTASPTQSWLPTWKQNGSDFTPPKPTNKLMSSSVA